jgi:hypothetical protein
MNLYFLNLIPSTSRRESIKNRSLPNGNIECNYSHKYGLFMDIYKNGKEKMYLLSSEKNNHEIMIYQGPIYGLYYYGGNQLVTYDWSRFPSTSSNYGIEVLPQLKLGNLMRRLIILF